MRRRRRHDFEIQHLLMTADAVGGIWSYSLELARALSEYGIRTTLAVMGPQPNPSQRREARRVPGLEVRTCDYALEWMPNPWQDVDAAGKWLLDLAARIRPDLVHLNGYSHASLPWKCPTLVVAHSDVATWWKAVKGEEPPAEEYAEYRRRLCLGLQAAEMVVSPTAAHLASVQELYGPFKDERVIYNGYRPEFDGGQEREPFILAAGRVWDDSKNFKLLSQIAGKISWPIQLAGNTRGAEPPEGVEALGLLPKSELRRKYEQASVFVHPALYEPFGLSVLEAAAAGCALVLADIPTLRELWHGAAIFADPTDPQAFTTAIQNLIENEVLRHVCGNSALRRSRLFDADAMSSQYVFAYHECLQSAALPQLLQGEVSVL